MPLVISFPGRVQAGTRIDDVVSLRDVGATVLDLAGIQPDMPFPGQSLSVLWNETVATDPPAVSPAWARLSPAGGLPTLA